MAIASNGSGVLQVYVRIQGQDGVKCVDVDSQALVQDLLAAATNNYALPGAFIEFQGKILESDSALADVGISAEAVVQLLTGYPLRIAHFLPHVDALEKGSFINLHGLKPIFPGGVMPQDGNYQIVEMSKKKRKQFCNFITTRMVLQMTKNEGNKIQIYIGEHLSLQDLNCFVVTMKNVAIDGRIEPADGMDIDTSKKTKAVFVPQY